MCAIKEFADLSVGWGTGLILKLSRERAYRRWTWAAGAAACGVVFTFIFLVVLDGYYPVDDTYITLHNAAAIWDRSDRNFPGSSPLTGSTSPIHLALVALTLPLFGQDSPAVVGALATAAYILGIVRLTKLEAGPTAQRYGVALLGAISGLMPLHLLNGMETSLALAVVTWLLVAARTCGPVVWLGALSGTSVFVRPELGVLSILLLTSRGIVLVRSGKARRAGSLMGAALLSGLPWAAWSLVTTGSLIPKTIAAKVDWFAEYQLPFSTRMASTMSGLADFACQLGPVILAAGALLVHSTGRLVLMFAACFYVASYVWMPSALTQYDSRYQYIIVPFLLLGLANWIGSRQKHRRQIATATLLAAVVFSLVTLPKHWGYFVRPYDLTRYELTSIARWCQDHVPPHSAVLVHDAGFLSYKTSFRLVDMVGLKTDLDVARDANAVNLNGSLARIASASKIAQYSGARFLVVRNDWDNQFRIADALRKIGWTVRLRRDWGFYRIYDISYR